MSEQLRFQSISQGDITYLRLYGVIDESLDPVELLNEATGKELILNLKAITRISSFGVREWVRTMELLSQRLHRLFLVECSPSIVAQLNMISNFAGTAQVVSVQVPYYCDACEWDTTATFDLTQGGSPDPHHVCRSCGGQMSVDDDPASYLAFTQGRASPSLDASVLQFLQSFAESAPSTGRTPKAPPGARLLTPLLRRVPPRVRQTLERWPTPVLAAGAAFVGGLIVLLIVAATRGSSPEKADVPHVPAAELSVYQGHLSAGRFEDARTLVAKLHDGGRIPAPLKASLERDIEQRRRTRLDALLREASQHYREKRYDAVLKATQEAEALEELGPDMTFLAAEALRRLNRLQDAATYYDRFETQAAKHHPQDRRRDDVVYWLAEAAVARGDQAQAEALFQRVITDFPKGNFKKSAARRLKDIRK